MGAAMSSYGVRLFIFFAGVFVLMAVIIVASIRYARKRTRDLAEIAQKIGFQFIGNNWSGPSSHRSTRLRCFSATAEISTT
jgi:hypothetical protein